MIYSNTQAFGEDMLWLIGTKLEKELSPRGTVFLLGHGLHNCHAALTPAVHAGVRTTWGQNTSLYIYRRESEVKAQRQSGLCDRLRKKLQKKHEQYRNEL